MIGWSRDAELWRPYGSHIAVPTRDSHASDVSSGGGPAMSDEGNRAEHARSLLHGAPQPAPRQPNPGELLMTFARGQDVYRCGASTS